MKTLIIYFSAERGTTERVAKDAAAGLGAELYPITPEKTYTEADLRYTNPMARCNREFFLRKEVPTVGCVENFADYDRVLIGFPIWYGCAPLVVSGFCKAYDWSGKTVAAFATSGGSPIGKTAEKLRPFLPGADFKGAKLVRSGSEVVDWVSK